MIESKKLLLTPNQVRYRLAKILMFESDEPNWPTTAGLVAKTVGEKYEEDYRRCLDICEMIESDEKRMRDKQASGDAFAAAMMTD